MRMDDDTFVIETDKETADRFIVSKHYSRRQGFFKKSFALVEKGYIQGIVVYGIPPLQVCKHAFKNRNFELLELVRLVIQTPTRNAASILIGRSLRLLATPCAVVSYADSAWGHSGIVYQATNWLYTGSTVSHDNLYIIDGKRIHPRTLASKGITSPARWAKDNNIETVPPEPKHRYFQFCGTRHEKKKMISALSYPLVKEYPKTDYSRYDDSEHISVQYYPDWLMPTEWLLPNENL